MTIIKAPITPGTQAQSVRRQTIRKDPQPLSTTARGGRKIQMIALKMFMVCAFNMTNGADSVDVQAHRHTKTKDRRAAYVLINP